jgi:NCS1 family nucleobase:cation symporter-1
LLRSSLGIYGAKYFGLLRFLVGTFMFGVQTYFLSKAFGYLIRILFFSIDNTLLDYEIFLTFFLGLNIIDWFSFTIVMFLQIILFSVGINYNKKIINISATIVYLGLALFFFIVFLSDVKLTSKVFVETLNFENFFNTDYIIQLLSVAATIFAYFSIIIVSFGDFSRYVKNNNELKKGNLSLILNLIIFSFFAVFIVIGSDVFLNQKFENIERIFTNPTDIIGKFNDLQITIIALFFIIFASASTNLAANFIPSQYSLINLIPSKLNLKSASYIIGILSSMIGIFWLTFLSQVGILSFIDTFSCFFGPIFGVMVVDYYLIKKENLINNDIYSLNPSGSYYYSGGWHLKAVYSIILGFIFSASSIWNVSLMFLQSYSWIIGGIIGSLTYYLLAKK